MTRNRNPQVAECAALSDQRAAECSEATTRDAVRADAIDAWIANCPVVLPEAMTLGIRAMVQASASRL